MPQSAACFRCYAPRPTGPTPRPVTPTPRPVIAAPPATPVAPTPRYEPAPATPRRAFPWWGWALAILGGLAALSVLSCVGLTGFATSANRRQYGVSGQPTSLLPASAPVAARDHLAVTLFILPKAKPLSSFGIVRNDSTVTLHNLKFRAICSEPCLYNRFAPGIVPFLPYSNVPLPRHGGAV